VNRLSEFIDIAGRFSRESKNDPFIVGGGVVLATKEENSIRAKLKMIPKWKNATPESLNLIAKIITEHNIFGSIVKIEKSSPEWERFWKKGRQGHRDLSSQFKGGVKFLKPGNIIRQLVLSRCAITSFMHYLESSGLPLILSPKGLTALSLIVVCDTDIQDEDSIAAFKKTWCRWSKRSGLEKTLEIEPFLETVTFKSESEEPILNLSDSLAGCIHASLARKSYKMPTRLDQSTITLLRDFIDSSEKLKNVSWSFKEIYPEITTAFTATAKSRRA
jgi:hypothetical protein